MTTPVLTLISEWEISEVRQISPDPLMFGDGYRQVITGVKTKREWDVTSPLISKKSADDTIAELRQYQGETIFKWSPDNGVKIPYGSYVCPEWTLTQSSSDVWHIQGKIVEVFEAECEEYAEFIASSGFIANLQMMVAGGVDWLYRYTRSSLPFAANAQGTTVNNFHVVIGRNGYYPPTSGTSEGQSIMMRALAFITLIDGVPQVVKASAKDLAVILGNAAVHYSFGGEPPTPAPGNLWIPHWIMNAKEPIVSKGPISDDPLNSGTFDTIVDFVNGLGIIPTSIGGDKTSDVYRVMSLDGKLLWKNVFASLVAGTNYPLQYYTFNLMMKGRIFRQPPIDNSGSGSLIESPIGEVAGVIKLQTPYTGQLKVIWAGYSGPTIPINAGVEAYPMWRPLRPTESSHAYDTGPWYWDAFDYLYKYTGDPRWAKCRDATYHTHFTGLNILNEPYCFKRENIPTPWSYPGTQAFVSNNSAPWSAQRTVSGCVLLTIGDGPETYPSAELQNFTTQFAFVDGAYLSVECGCSDATTLEIAVSTSNNAFDNSQLWVYYHRVAAMGAMTASSPVIPAIVNIAASQLARWPTIANGTATMWHPTALNPALYPGSGGSSGGTGTAAVNLAYETIDGQPRLVYACTLSKRNYGYGNIYVPTIEAARGSTPPTICYRLTVSRAPGITYDRHIQYEVQDGSGNKHRFMLADTGGAWMTVTFDWSQRVGGPGWPSDVDGGVIQSVSFQTLNELSNQDVSLGVWWVGAAPMTLAANTRCYKFSLTTRVETAHQVIIGNVIAVNSPVADIRYQPGSVPFVVNKYQGSIDGWREGGLYPGYQSPYHMNLWGYIDYCNTQSQCLLDAQAAYTRQSPTRLTGPMAPVFVRAVWSSPPYGEPDTWGWQGADPGTEWAQYCYRPIEAAARSYLYNKRDKRARRVVNSALNWLDKAIRAEPYGRVPTNIRQSAAPTTLYHDPGAAGIVLRAAIYANLAGINKGVTFRIIVRLYNYLLGQYVSSGLMAGSFSKDQPPYIVPPTPGHIAGNYSEYFVFWHGEALEAIALLLKHRDDLKIPPCSSRL